MRTRIILAALAASLTAMVVPAHVATADHPSDPPCSSTHYMRQVERGSVEASTDDVDVWRDGVAGFPFVGHIPPIQRWFVSADGPIEVNLYKLNSNGGCAGPHGNAPTQCVDTEAPYLCEVSEFSQGAKFIQIKHGDPAGGPETVNYTLTKVPNTL